MGRGHAMHPARSAVGAQVCDHLRRGLVGFQNAAETTPKPPKQQVEKELQDSVPDVTSHRERKPGSTTASTAF